MIGKPEDIATDVASRMLNKNMDLVQAMKAVGYGGLLAATSGTKFDTNLIAKARESGSKTDRVALEKAIVKILDKAEKLKAKARTGSLEDTWGKTAYDKEASGTTFDLHLPCWVQIFNHGTTNFPSKGVTMLEGMISVSVERRGAFTSQFVANFSNIHPGEYSVSFSDVSEIGRAHV